MHELAVAEIDPDVRDAFGVGLEEHEVTRDRAADGRMADVVLSVRGPRQADAGHGEDVLNVGRAV